VPWAVAKTVADEEDTDEDRDGESNHGSDSTDRENSPDRDGASENEKEQQDSDDGIKPYGVDWCIRDLVYSLDPKGAREAVITSVCKGHARCGDHAALAHGETTDDGESQDGEGDLLGHDLDQISGPRLAKVRVDDRGNIDDGICYDELESPSCQTAKAGCHHDSTR